MKIVTKGAYAALLLLFLCINISVVYSQSDFKKGYIITNNMDTVYGYIDYNSDLYYKCIFKKGLEDITQEYTPFQIYGYRFIDDKFYVSKQVTLQNSYVQNKETDFKNAWDERYISKAWYTDSTKRTERVFAEYLIKGKLNVYFFNDSRIQSHYFVSKDNDSLVDLTPELIMIYENGNLFSKEYSTKYKGKLLSLMAEYPQLRNEIQNTSVNHRALIKVAKDYHKLVCNDNSCIIYAREVKKTKVNCSFSAGIGYSEISKINYRNYSGLRSSPVFTDNHTIHAGFDVHVLNYLPQFEKTSFKLGAEIIKNRYKNEYTYLYLGKDLNAVRYYNSYSICLNMRLIQKFSTKSQTPYLGIGYSGIYSFNESLEDSKLNNNEVSDDFYNQFQNALFLSLGYEWTVFNDKHITAELQHKQCISKLFNTSIALGFEF